ncbi:HAD family phosphatase [Sphingomonas sp.]|uniref:HAD family hydrolase n=1 Tax=Sphingomonas sp. TaxID=28214 RepID=UPI0025E91463|nr:HAD family phosphatase [Sphingomonas sp.]
MKFDAIIFDFDGVLLESEYAGNKQIAEYLTGAGHPTTPAESMAHFMGLAGQDFIAAIERWTGRPMSTEFQNARAAEDARVMREGIEEVAGAVAFVRSLPTGFPKAIASSSSSAWIVRHLEHLGISDIFGDMIFSGREHVTHGKPAPDIYLHAAAALGVEVIRSVILEDSPVGATAAVASRAHVIGFCGGSHCSADHADRLRAIGVDAIASDFHDVRRLIF